MFTPSDIVVLDFLGVTGIKPIHLIGVEFSKDERNVAAFDVKRACV